MRPISSCVIGVTVVSMAICTKEWSSLLEQELNIKETLQNYTLEQLLPIETFPCVDKLIAQHLQMEVANSTMTVEQIRKHR